MSSFKGTPYPFVAFRRDRRGIFEVKTYRQTWLSYDSLSTADMVAQLTAQFTKIPTSAVVTACGPDAIAIYLPPLLGEGRIRITHTPARSDRPCPRWDVWDPQIHKAFLGDRPNRWPHVKIEKDLRGVVLGKQTMHRLDAMRWDVMLEYDLILKFGTELTW